MKIITASNKVELFSNESWGILKRISKETPNAYQKLLGQLKQLFPDIAVKIERNDMTINEAKLQLQSMTLNASSTKIVVTADMKGNIQKGLAILGLMSGLATSTPGQAASVSFADFNEVAQRTAYRGEIERQNQIATGEGIGGKTGTFKIVKVNPQDNVIIAKLQGDQHYFIQMPNGTNVFSGQTLDLSIKPSTNTYSTGDNVYRLFILSSPEEVKQREEIEKNKRQQVQEEIEKKKRHQEDEKYKTMQDEKIFEQKRQKSIAKELANKKQQIIQGQESQADQGYYNGVKWGKDKAWELLKKERGRY